MVLDGFWRHVLHVDIKLREGDFDMFLCKGLIDGEAQIRGRALDEGEILSIRMNDGEPVRNVPRSIKEEGHQILKLIDNEDGTYNLIVRKVEEE